jgi:hypothetical protein
MSWSFVNHGTVATGASPVPGMPASFIAGDILLIVATSKTAYSATPPTGYSNLTRQTSAPMLSVWYKIATGSETSPTLTNSDTSSCAVILAYRGLAAFDAQSTVATGTSTSPSTTNHATTTAANDLVLSIYGGSTTSSSTGAWTANGSTTNRVSSTDTTSLTGLLVADETQAASGASATRQATQGKSVAWQAITVAFQIPIALTCSETGNAVDSTNGVVTIAETTTESGNAVDVSSSALEYLETTTEAGNSKDVSSSAIQVIGALTESGNALDTNLGVVGMVAAAGGGNYSSTSTWVGGVVPTSANDAILKSTSGSVTIDGTSGSPNYCHSLNCTGYTNTLTMTSTSELVLTGSLTLSAGMTCTFDPNAAFVFESTALGNTVTTGGQSMPTTYLGYGVNNGGYSLQDNFTCLTNAAIWFGVYNGNNTTVNTNGHTLTIPGQLYCYAGYNGDTGTLTLGSSAVNANYMYVYTDATQFSGASASYNNSGASQSQLAFQGTGPYTLSSAVFTNVATAQLSTSSNGGDTLGTVSFTGAAQVAVCTVGSMTVTGTFTANGNSAANRLLVCDFTVGDQATLTVATLATQYSDWQGIVGAGAASWNLSAITGKSGDGGNNSGITFTSPITAYLKCPTASNYNYYDVNNWYTTSGGSTHASRAPLGQDTGIIDANSFGATGIIFYVNYKIIPNLDMSAATHSPTVAFQNSPLLIGNLISASTGVMQNGVYLCGNGTNSYSVTSNGADLTALDLTIMNGNYTFTNSMTIADLSGAGANTVSFSNITLTITSNIELYGWGGPIPSPNFGGTYNFNSSTVIWQAAGYAYFYSGNINMGSSTFEITNTSASAKNIETNANPVMGNVIVSGAASCGPVNFPTNNQAFGVITLNAYANVTFGANAYTTVTGFVANGSSGTITIASSSGGSQANLSCASGIISVDYVSLQDSNATGGAQWYAGNHSTNVSNNTGWIFAAPAVSSEFGSALDVSSESIVIAPTVIENGAAFDQASMTLTLVVSNTSSGSAQDVESQVTTFPQTATEAGSALDASSEILTLPETTSEAGSAQDAASEVPTFPQTTSETGKGVDTSSEIPTFPQTTSETGSVLDVESESITFSATVPETGNAIDVESQVPTFPQTDTEVGNAIDSLSQIMTTSQSVTETGSGHDTQSQSMTAPVSVSDAGNGVDALSSVVTVPGTVVDTGNAIDSEAQTTTMPQTSSESGSAADASSQVNTSFNSTAEVSNAADSTAENITFSNSVTDAGNSIDSETEILTLPESVAETGAGADQLSQIMTSSVSTTEAQTIKDSDSQVMTAPVSVSDAGNGADVLTQVMTAPVSVSDTGLIADAFSQLSTLSNTTSEMASLTEGVTELMTANISLVEVGAMGDLVVEVMTANIIFVEAGAASDILSQTYTAISSVSESGGAQDALSEIMTANLTVSEGGSAQDVESESMFAAVTLSESILIYDIPSVVYTAFSTVQEYGSSSDSTDVVVILLSTTSEYTLFYDSVALNSALVAIAYESAFMLDIESEKMFKGVSDYYLLGWFQGVFTLSGVLVDNTDVAGVLADTTNITGKLQDEISLSGVIQDTIEIKGDPK